MFGYHVTELISQDRIQDRLREIADDISARYRNRIPILIGVLNGSFIVMADLIRYLTIDCEMDFIKVSSYAKTESTGTVRLLKDISADITGRDVIIVEDIIDSGLTITFLKDRLEGASPHSLAFATLLMKPDITNIDFPIDYVGFEIPPDYVVGYGLDYDQKLRHLPGIYRLEGKKIHD